MLRHCPTGLSTLRRMRLTELTVYYISILTIPAASVGSQRDPHRPLGEQQSSLVGRAGRRHPTRINSKFISLCHFLPPFKFKAAPALLTSSLLSSPSPQPSTACPRSSASSKTSRTLPNAPLSPPTTRCTFATTKLSCNPKPNSFSSRNRIR